MTNQASIQVKIWRGYAQAAKKLGANFQFYRPHAGNFPGNPTIVLPISLNAEDMKYGKPSKYAKSTWYALFDGSHARVGDYLLSQSTASLTAGVPLQDRFGGALEGSLAAEIAPDPDTFFIAAMQPLLPILVVECNRTISVAKASGLPGIEAPSYGGVTQANTAPFVSDVPCSILQGTKGEKNAVGLPSDVRSPWWTILMPACVGVVALGDLIIDDLGNRYVVSSAELTDLGYRLTAMMAMT